MKYLSREPITYSSSSRIFTTLKIILKKQCITLSYISDKLLLLISIIQNIKGVLRSPFSF